MQVSASLLPLFPLRTVLFPGGRLPLRVFEQRYLDLVRECARSGHPFGISLIMEGAGTGAPATPAAIGTGAHIVDFDQLPDGLLGITVRGGQRFHVTSARVRDNGLVLASVQWLPEPPVQPVPAQYGLLVRLLETMLDHDGSIAADSRRMDDADWVAYRLAETLPLSAHERQAILQCNDAGDRLQRLLVWLSNPDATEPAPSS